MKILIFLILLVVSTLQNSHFEIKYKDIDKITNGTLGQEDFALYQKLHKQLISNWHDIPYKNADGTYNFITEIPKWTRNKMEINKDVEFNPIM